MEINLNWGGLYTTLQGIQHLMDLYYRIMFSPDVINTIEMSKVAWIDANMCAPFGALLHSYINSPQKVGKKLILTNMNDTVENILRKNGFLSDVCLDEPKEPDIYKTTIEYQKFESSEPLLFKNYVERHFINKHMEDHIPRMSASLQKKFRRSIFEIFENAVYHSETEQGIFACGQYFPTKDLLKFSVADLGIGIRNNIYNRLGLDLSPERAISWAVDGENTTRALEDGIPGGLGLKLIKNFIYANEGEMTIVSDRGYCKFKNGRELVEKLRSPFPGTVVNITINASGKVELPTYEVIPKNIF